MLASQCFSEKAWVRSMTFPLLKIQNLHQEFRVKGRILHALQDFSLTLPQGEILGLGGESGCGKSTAAKLIMGFMPPTRGSIYFEGKNLNALAQQKSQDWRERIQMIFQHPAGSLNPRLTVEETLLEPFIIHDLAKGEERSRRIREILAQVGLTEEELFRFPNELSGGQKQRIAIARAIACQPRLLICDEPFSALDVSVQAQIIELLKKLQIDQGMSYLVISHDLSILHYLAHRMAIMYLGMIVEIGSSSEVYGNPLHPYSQLLIDSVLVPDPIKERKKSVVRIKGDVPSLFSLPTGCPFYSRCPIAQKVCQNVKPILREVHQGHFVACHAV